MSATPGPWKWDRATGQVDCDGGTIAHRIDWAPNGPLIAAAPDMATVLRLTLLHLKVRPEQRLASTEEALAEAIRDVLGAVDGRTP